MIYMRMGVANEIMRAHACAVRSYVIESIDIAVRSLFDSEGETVITTSLAAARAVLESRHSDDPRHCVGAVISMEDALGMIGREHRLSSMVLIATKSARVFFAGAAKLKPAPQGNEKISRMCYRNVLRQDGLIITIQTK